MCHEYLKPPTADSFIEAELQERTFEISPSWPFRVKRHWCVVALNTWAVAEIDRRLGIIKSSHTDFVMETKQWEQLLDNIIILV